MNENQIKILMQLLMPKGDLIVNEIKHELITLAQPELNQVQLVVIDNAIKGALISGMRTTIERILSNNEK